MNILESKKEIDIIEIVEIEWHSRFETNWGQNIQERK